MPYRVSRNSSELLDMTQTCRTKMLKIARHDPNSREKNCGKLLKVGQNCWRCLKMGQEVSIGVMCLHIQVRKLPLLGIAVAGVFCCMGLRSMPIEPRCYVQNLRSSVSTDRDHLSLDWLSWFQYVSINGLTRKNIIALIEKTVHARSFFHFVTAFWWYHNQTWIPGILTDFLRFWKLSDLNLTDLHPKLRTVITCAWFLTRWGISVSFTCPRNKLFLKCASRIPSAMRKAIPEFI